MADFRDIVELGRNTLPAGRRPVLIGGLSTALGCSFEGRVAGGRGAAAAPRSTPRPAPTKSLVADTVGYGDPAQVRAVFKAVMAEVGALPVGAHFHDTRGTGLANVAAAARLRRAALRRIARRAGRLPVRARRQRQHRHGRSVLHARLDGPQHRRRSGRSCSRSAQVLARNLAEHGTARRGRARRPARALRPRGDAPACRRPVDRDDARQRLRQSTCTFRSARTSRRYARACAASAPTFPAPTGASWTSGMPIPTAFVDGADRGGLPGGADTGGIRRRRPAAARGRRDPRGNPRRGLQRRPACHAQMYIMGTLLRHGSAAQKASTCRGSRRGELRLQAFGVTEPTTGTDTTKLKTRRGSKDGDGDHYVINGQKVWTSRALHSDLMLLLARTTPLDQVRRGPTGLSVFLLDMRDASAGDGNQADQGDDQPQHHGGVLRRRARAVENLIGEEGKGFRYILDGMNAERILVSPRHRRCALVHPQGGRYGGERIVFDRPIGQEPGHPVPDRPRLRRNRGGRHRAAQGGGPVPGGGLPCGDDANMAKLLASDAAWHAAEACMQTHGGFGYARRVRRRAQMARDAPAADRADLDQPHSCLHRRAHAGHAEILLTPTSACGSGWRDGDERRPAQASTPERAVAEPLGTWRR